MIEHIIDKIILLIAGLLLKILFGLSKEEFVIFLIAFLVVVSLSCLHSYCFSVLLVGIGWLFFCVVSLWFPIFCFFIPLICYDICLHKRFHKIGIGGSIVFFVFFHEIGEQRFLLILFVFLAGILSDKAERFYGLQKKYRLLRDNDVELQMLLRKQNKNLLEQQEIRMHLIKIEERNRIAREIHDNVGHLLSRALLLVGAMQTINQKNGQSHNLKQLKDTLSEAMDRIRKSVHDLRDDTVSLQEEVEKLVSGFSAYQIQVEYDCLEEPKKELKTCFLLTIKEALSNVVKHSNATEILIVLREHPGFYQLLVEDNGTLEEKLLQEGMGIESMRQRVMEFSGIFSISMKKGFRIFISIPKQNKKKIEGENK